MIIEYNGSAYHYHESFGVDWTPIFGNKEESIRFDKQKNEFARLSGYNVILVWDFEVNSKNRLHNKIKELVNELSKTVV